MRTPRLVVGIAARLLVPGGATASPQAQYQLDVFVATSDGPVELTAFAAQSATVVCETNVPAFRVR